MDSIFIMLAAFRNPDSFTILPSQQALPEIHRSTISLHHAKKGCDYPSVRLPHTFSNLIGLSTRIYEAPCKGSLAFIVVVSPPKDDLQRCGLKIENAEMGFKSARLDMAEVAGSNPAEPIRFLGCFDEITGSGELFDLRF
jgi:hypothetical protein